MDKLKNLTAAAVVDFLLNLGNEAVRLIGGYTVILSPATIPLAPVSIITLLLYNTILSPIADWRLRLLISLLIGLALESFALACLIVSRHAEEFNLTREPGEPEMNQGAGKWALAAYIILGISMVIVGEILPHYQWLEDAQIARWTLLGFFGLAPFGHWIFATEHNIRRLEARRKQRQAEAQALRESDLRQAEQETVRREREAAIREREAQADAIRARARAEEHQAEAEIIKRQAALVRAEARKTRAVNLPEIFHPGAATLPEGLNRIPASLADFRQMVHSGEAKPEGLTGTQLARAANITNRTARNWLAAVRRNGAS